MKRIAIALFLLLAFRYNTALGQSGIASVDTDSILALIRSDFREDSLYHVAETALRDHFAERVKAFQTFAEEIEKRIECATPRDHKRGKDWIRARYDSLLLFEKTITDSLQEMRKKLIAGLNQVIAKEINSIARQEGFDFVVAERNLLFADVLTNRTEETIRRIAQAPVRKAIADCFKVFRQDVDRLLKN